MSTSSQDPTHLRGDQEDVRRRAWRALWFTHARLLKLFEEEMRERFSLDLQSYEALLHIYEAGESGLRMTDLADKAVLSKSGLTALADRLEAAGLIRRVPDPHDRRAIRITLTERGREGFLRAGRAHVASIHTHFGDFLSDEEATAIADGLERVQRALTAGEQQEPGPRN